MYLHWNQLWQRCQDIWYIMGKENYSKNDEKTGYGHVKIETGPLTYTHKDQYKMS